MEGLWRNFGGEKEPQLWLRLASAALPWLSLPAFAPAAAPLGLTATTTASTSASTSASAASSPAPTFAPVPPLLLLLPTPAPAFAASLGLPALDGA